MLTHDFKTSSVFGDRLGSRMDANRHCVRRLVPHKEAEFSSQSIMKTMEKFVQAVQEMDETILVPCRLMDLKVGDDTDTISFKAKRGERDGLSSTDLYRLYTMVNCVKNELLWGAKDCPPEESDATTRSPPTATILQTSTPSPLPPVSSISPTTATTTTSSSSSQKTHVRRPSTASLTSTNSAGSTISDTDSETGIENDSGIEGEPEATPKQPDYTQKIEESFRRHLYGLHKSLEQMTEAASYLTKRYQKDIDGSV